CLLLDGGAVLF
nr:immunoglobulin light chain junction region [Macaca mulatta]